MPEKASANAENQQFRFDLCYTHKINKYAHTSTELPGHVQRNAKTLLLHLMYLLQKKSANSTAMLTCRPLSQWKKLNDTTVNKHLFSLPSINVVALPAIRHWSSLQCELVLFRCWWLTYLESGLSSCRVIAKIKRLGQVQCNFSICQLAILFRDTIYQHRTRLLLKLYCQNPRYSIGMDAKRAVVTSKLRHSTDVV